MTWFRASFEWAGDLYATLFADWLHVGFLIRTVIILLMLLIVIFVAAQLFKFVFGPLIVLVYVNVVKRAWNFLVTETLHEWIYINYYSNGDTKHAEWYMRLCDRVKRNRAVLSDTGFKSILGRGRVRKLGNYLMISAAIVAALWVGAFGLSQEYAMPAWAGNIASDAAQNDDIDEYAGYVEPEEPEADNETDEAGNTEESQTPRDIYIPGMVSPRSFPAEGQIVFALTEAAGDEGARVRDGPGTGTVVIEMLFGYDLMTYMGYYIPDSDVATLYWLRVSTPSGTEGYIASHLVTVVG